MHILWMVLAALLTLPFSAEAVAPLMPATATPGNFAVPSGWVLNRTQTFESGLGPQEFLFPPATICQPPVGAHNGTKASCGGLSKGWGIEPAPFVEHYVIYWQYIDGNVTFNDEMLEWHMLHNTGQFQEHLLDWYNNKRVDLAQGWGEFNSKYANFKPVSNGPRDHQFNSLLGDTIVPVGQWFQMQVYFKPNTPGNSDGIIRAWQNGVPLADTTDDLVGSTSMTGSRFSLGGSYTKLLWWTNSSVNVCSDTMSKGFSPSINADPTHARCTTTPCICPPEPPTGNRYFDDIIILTPTAGPPPPPDTTPPSTPSALAATPGGANQVTLTWNASTDNIAVANYVIKWCTGVSCTPTATLASVASPTLTYVHAGLTPVTTYGYSIGANDASNNLSTFSSIVYATTTTTFRSVITNDLFARADSTDVSSQWDAGYSGSGLGTGAVNAQIVSGRVRGTSITGDAFETFNGVSGAGVVAVDAVGGSCAGCTAAPTSPVTLTHVVGGSGNALYLECAVGVRGSGSSHPANNQDADFVIGTPTYNGVSMTQVGSNIHSGGGHTGYFALYRLLAPATGSHTVSVPFTNTNPDVRDAIECGSVSFTGVDQTTPESFTSATGSSASASVTVTSAVGNIVLDILAAGSNYVSSTQTNRWNKNNNTNTAGGNGAGSTAAGAASVVMGYTVINDGWAIGGANIRASTAALPNDQWSSVVIQNYVAATANVGLACRFADTPTMTGYIAGIRPPGQTAYIEKWTAGTKADLTAVSSLLPAVGDTLSFECEGTALRLFLKHGTSQFLIASTTDATVASGKAGIRLKPTGALADIEIGQFVVGTFTATDPNPVAPSIASATVDATGGNLTYGVTTPTNIRVQNFFGASGTTNTIRPISAFPGGRYTNTWLAGSTSVCWYAIDAAGVENSANSLYYKCNNLIGVAPSVDTTAPVMSNGQPSATQPAGTTSVQLSVTTNEMATCHYSTSDVAYTSMLGTMTQAGLVSSATLTGLTNGMTPTSYYIRCIDVSNNVDSASLTVIVAVAAVTVDTTVPSTVTNVAAVALNSSQINLSWTVATDNVAVAGYNVYLSYGAGNTTYILAGTPTGTSTSLLGITPSSTVNIVVRAVDTSGNLSAADSAVQTVTTPAALDTVPPSDMTNLRLVAAAQLNVLLAWDAGTDDQSGTITATLERCAGSGCTNFVVVPNIPTHISGLSVFVSLTPNTLYRFRGKFSDTAGNTSANYSNILDVTTSSSGLGTIRTPISADRTATISRTHRP